MDDLERTRFWKKVRRGAADECWPWLGGKTAKGYGRCRFAGSRKFRRAHRMAYVLTHGEVEDHQLVLHSCDNPPCCNPAHLRLGVHWDNVWDMDSRGRRRGSPPVKPKQPHMEIALTKELVDALRRQSQRSGRSMASLIREGIMRVCETC